MSTFCVSTFFKTKHFYLLFNCEQVYKVDIIDLKTIKEAFQRNLGVFYTVYVELNYMFKIGGRPKLKFSTFYLKLSVEKL